MSDLRQRLNARLVESEGGCLVWTGAKRNQHGYGQISVGSRLGGTAAKAYTHRVAWELTYGSIPDGLHVLHRCDNPPCCNPEHLFLGTHAENMADKVAKGRSRRGIASTRGEAHGMSRLTERQVSVIRDRYAAGATQTALAAEFGVTQQAISLIVNRRKWAHVGRAA